MTQNKPKIIPDKLRLGDEMRVIAPATSLTLLSKEHIEFSTRVIQNLGLKLTFSKNVSESDEFGSSSIKSRIDDIHEAFRDQNVKMILPVIGGYNSNQLLKYLDYDLIQKNPKILGGYSDITALQNAITSRTGLITFQSLSFSSFGKLRNNDYGIEFFKKCFFKNQSYEIYSSAKWDDAQWYKDQQNYELFDNDGIWKIQNCNIGEDISGQVIGGNLCTLNLLQGTQYMPNLTEDTILFIEDDDLAGENTMLEFERNLLSLLMSLDLEKVKAVIFGRFQIASKVSKENLIKIISTKEELKNIPVYANLDFGHTYPAFSFPIGGKCEIKNSNISLSW